MDHRVYSGRFPATSERRCLLPQCCTLGLETKQCHCEYFINQAHTPACQQKCASETGLSRKYLNISFNCWASETSVCRLVWAQTADTTRDVTTGTTSLLHGQHCPLLDPRINSSALLTRLNSQVFLAISGISYYKLWQWILALWSNNKRISWNVAAGAMLSHP